MINYELFNQIIKKRNHTLKVNNFIVDKNLKIQSSKQKAVHSTTPHQRRIKGWLIPLDFFFCCQNKALL
jgi:carbonic anhydrase